MSRLSAIVVSAAVMVVSIAPARAADMPAGGDGGLNGAALRGSFSNFFSPTGYRNWDGVNFGVHIGRANIDTDFGDSTGQAVAYILRNSTLENEAAPSQWTALPHDVTSSHGYGAFVGYSVQADELVVGLDATYTRMSSLQSQASDSISRRVTTSDNVTHDVTITAQSTMKLVDYATVRGRAGYATGAFLPYAFVGGAVGRFNYTSSATVTSFETPPVPGIPFTYGPFTQSNNKDNAIVGGFTAGLGMDVALLPNVFLRGEWEFVGFAPVNGIRSVVNTGRVGVGMRF